jgi:hypothetical protein
VFKTTQLSRAMFALALLASLAACSGNSGTPITAIGSHSTPTPVPTATAAASVCGTSATESSPQTYTSFTAGGTIALPALGSCSVTFTFPSGSTFSSPSPNVAVTTSQITFFGAPAVPTTYSGYPLTSLLYEAVVINSGSITVPASPAEVLTVAAFPITSGCFNFVEYSGSPLGWAPPIVATSSTATTATFASNPGGGTTFGNGNEYFEYFAEFTTTSGC